MLCAIKTCVEFFLGMGRSGTLCILYRFNAPAVACHVNCVWRGKVEAVEAA